MWLDGSCADCAANTKANCRPYRNAYSNADCYSCTDATSHDAISDAATVAD